MFSKKSLSAVLVLMIAVAGVFAQEEILSVKFKHQQESALINNEEKTIFVKVPYSAGGKLYPLSKAVLENIEFSGNFTHNLPETVDLRKDFSFTVSDSKGKKTEWKIKGGYQLPDSDFGTWHTEKITGFLTIGSTKCDDMPGPAFNVWDNGNPAFSASGSKNWPTKKIVLKDGSVAAELTTRKVVGTIASGNLFTGYAVRDMSLKQLLGFTDKDGKALITWGVPFEGRPKGFKVKFFYDGKDDECSLVATLENRNGSKRRFVANACYIGKTDSRNNCSCPTQISAADSNGLKTLTVDFLYGTYPAGANPIPEGVVQGSGDEDVNMVNVVFASSAHGDYFEGKKNARLIVKDFEFIY